MLINRVPRLACRTQVGIAKKENTREGSDDIFVAGQKSEEENEIILIEPLANLKVIRDLVVDMDTFYTLVDSIKPWINSPEKHPEGGNLMSPDLREKIEKYTNCILCACCHGACPVAARDDTSLSPATLAKAWRMHLDPRRIMPVVRKDWILLIQTLVYGVVTLSINVWQSARKKFHLQWVLRHSESKLKRTKKSKS